MPTRRRFLGGILAGVGALVVGVPALRAGPPPLPPHLPITQIPRRVPEALRLWGDGIHDDAPALQAMINSAVSPIVIPTGTYTVGQTITISSGTILDGGGSTFTHGTGFRGAIFSLGAWDLGSADSS